MRRVFVLDEVVVGAKDCGDFVLGGEIMNF